MKRKIKPYLIISSLIILLFIMIFITKGIYPFGENSLIWGDMEDQVTAFFYHFYDSIRGNASIFVDFTTSGSINFFGILTYYLLSPVSMLIALFPRDNIYQAISIIIAVKVLLSGLTAYYAISKSFPKSKEYISILLAIMYALSGFSIVMYQITAWADIVYLFPLLFLGLKKTLDLKKPYLYIIILTISFILCFYSSILMLLFIFFISLIYLYFYNKDNIKKCLINLGIGTFISIALSAIILIPSYHEISESSRMAFDINELLNSKFDMFGDKLMLLITIGAILGPVIYFIIKSFKQKKDLVFTKFTCITLAVFIIPILIEPVNKIFHLGSYALFPLRTSFMFYFFLIYVFMHYISTMEEKKTSKKHNIIYSILSAITIISIITITVLNYKYFQHKIYGISVGSNWKIPLIAIIITIVIAIVIGTMFISKKNNYSKFNFLLMYLVAFTNITCWSFVYFGMDFAFKDMTTKYSSMTKLSNSYEEGNYYRIKSVYPNLIQNYGMITKYHTLDHFTSLTNGNNMLTLRSLGYSSYWVKTYSIGGSLFTDSVLANKYLISKDKINDEYYEYIDTFGSINMYQLKNNISYGYLIDHNTNIIDTSNALEAQNNLYQALTGTKDNIMTIYNNEFACSNLNITNIDDLTSYKIIDKDLRSSLKTKVHVNESSILYLEVLKSTDNNINKTIMDSLNIYVNGKLFIDDYPKEINNGLLNLGTYENQDVEIDIQITKNLNLSTITLGSMSLSKYYDFVNNNGISSPISYNKNNISLSIAVDDEKTLFLPITYNNDYTLKVNGEVKDIELLFDNYIGVKLNTGENNIELTYVSGGLKTGLIISILVLIMTIILFKTKLYNIIIENKIIQNFVYYGFLLLYFILVVAFFIVPILAFIISFFHKFNL